MRRRTFIAGLGSAAAWPVVAQAQQRAVAVVAMSVFCSVSSARISALAPNPAHRSMFCTAPLAI
jgi:hypothetical protein